jgi:ribonuclease BN (tRNA processing enzyme)
MKLHVIGSADAFNSSGRGHSCYVLQSPGAARLMVDFGPTALAGLRQAGVPPEAIDGITFTHLHGDHIGGFPFLLIDALFNAPRRRELPILGPLRTRECLEALLDASYDDMKQRMPQLPVSIAELAPGETREFLGYQVSAYAADHMQPPHRPLCLRVSDAHGKSVAFSGDTRMCPGLFEAADGAGLLVAECTRLAHPAGQHCTWDEWQAELRDMRRLRARALMLTHLGADVRARLPGLCDGLTTQIPVTFAEDGAVVEID